jgi:3-oxoadipate enol-lactonase
MPDASCGAATLRYRVHGSGEPPVLLIHGTAAALWGDLIDRLVPSHRVVDYDRRGYGASDGPSPRTLAEHTDDVLALLDRLAIERAVVVVGWSIGGVIALDLAVREPGRVLGLVLVEPPLHVKRHPTPRLIRGVIGARLRGRRDPRAGADRFLRWALHDRTQGRPEEAVPAGWWEAMLANGAAIVHEVGLGTGEQLTKNGLGSIRQPTVVLHGDRSDAGFARAARRIAATIPSARLVAVTGSGHAMQADRPDAITAAVESLRPAWH